MNKKALLQEWAREERRAGFFLLLFLQASPLLLLWIRRQAGGDASFEEAVYLSKQLLMLFLPLTALWGFSRSKRGELPPTLMELPLDEMQLLKLLNRFLLESLLLFLVPLFGFLLLWQTFRFDPALLLLSPVALIIQGMNIQLLSRLVFLFVKGKVKSLVFTWLLLLISRLIQPLVPWGLSTWHQAYFRGASLLFSLIILLLMEIAFIALLRKARKGWK